MLVDSHCHLNYEGLKEDIPGAVANAKVAGVSTLLTISTRFDQQDELKAITDAYPNVWRSVGVHPHEAGADEHQTITADHLVAAASDPKVVGIGECGLDYYYDNAPREAQRTGFHTHIAAARETQLPVIVHTRDADDDTAAILTEEMEQGAFPGVIHCFTASNAFAKKALELGLYISLSGIVTFKNAKDIQETAKMVPEDRLLVETDSPFLAPVPHRGKKCQPAYTADTARFVAELRGVSLEHLAKTTTNNFFRLFSKAERPSG